MGFYDIFLIDYQTGDIIYSVFKETDFGRNLLSKELSSTGLSKVYTRLKESTDNIQVFEDFSRYWPSYDKAQGFVGQ